MPATAIKTARLQALYDERAKANEDSKKILDAVEAAGRTMSGEEQQQWDAMDARIQQLGDEIDRREKQAKREAFLAESRGRIIPASASAGDREVDHSGPIKMAFTRANHQAVLAPNSRDWRRAQPEYRESFLNYLSNGGISAGMETSQDNKGGYLAPMQFVQSIIKFLDDEVFMRQIANVLPPMTEGKSIGVPSWDTDPSDADWTAEVSASAISEDDTARVGLREMSPNLLTKLVKCSNKLIRAAALDIESYIIQRLGYKFGITEEKAFLTGTGAMRPLGVFTASTQGISTGRDTTCSSTTAFTGDEVIDTLYALKGQYQQRATWIVHRDFVKRLRKLKDGNGQYLWSPGLTSGQPGTICDRPYVMSENAPSTFTTGQYIAIVGDFKTGYWIVDSLGMEVQRLGELYALQNQVAFVGRKETDGAPVLEECFSRMKLA